MGIVRLAKALKQLNSLTEISSRKKDLSNKLDGNRVYMDFISIVYRIQDSVIMEVNNFLYQLILLKHQVIGIHDLDQKLAEKYDMAEFIKLYENMPKDTDPIDNFIKKTTLNISNYIYKDVVAYVVDIICQKISNTEYLLIAFDGIPSFAKIQEQRQRRYMRYCGIEFQRHIIQSNADNPKKNNKYSLRDLFDSLKFIPLIRQSIDYVYDRYEKGYLKNDIIKGSKKICIDMNPKIEVVNEKYGEGEKILMDRIIDDYLRYPDSSYVFFSPDGDSVLLSLQIYLVRKIERFSVIKQYYIEPTNEHNNKCQYVDIPKLYNAIIKKVSTYGGFNIDDHANRVELSDGIVRDYQMLMTFYGNDFLHQIPTMEISSTHLDLIYCYAKYLEKEQKCILTIVNQKTVIDAIRFKNFMSLLSEHEEMIMLDSYLAECDSRKRIVKYFGELFTHKYLLDYKEKVGIIKEQMLNSSKEGTVLENILSNGLEELKQYTIPYGYSYDQIFRQCEIKNKTKYIENIIAGKHRGPHFIYRISHRRNKNGDVMWRMIREIEDPLIQNNQNISVDNLMNDHIGSNHMNADEFDKFLFDYRNIRKLVPHPMMPTTSNDLDLYLLDWKGGKWREILNAYPYDFGFDTRTQKKVNLNYEMKRYQKHFLEIGKTQIIRMCEFYLQGIGWIVDYMMNNHTHKTHISTWSYNYHRVPFITHLSNACRLIDNPRMTKLMNGVYKKTMIRTTKYLDKKGQSLYIYPLNESDKKLFIDNLKLHPYSSAFPDMDKYVKDSIYQYKTKSYHKYFDCRLCPYFSKCIFESKNLTYCELKKIIQIIYPEQSDSRLNIKEQVGGYANNRLVENKIINNRPVYPITQYPSSTGLFVRPYRPYHPYHPKQPSHQPSPPIINKSN